MQDEIITWFDTNARDLPWRKSNPWGVMVSEFMLQQTPVHRVLPMWEQWMERWPTPNDLALAKKSDAISAWGRLGYPRRAIRLHESAQIIVRDFDGLVPQAIEQLRTLPGVGEYTAAAISAFAYGRTTLVLDVNIRRLFARAIDGVEIATPSLSHIERAMRAELMPTEGARWAAATMELGALVCTARTPDCEACPIKSQCKWRENGYPASELPKKKSQAWNGTDRQCRGTIIQGLRDSKKLSKSELIALWSDEAQLLKAIETLIADGLIETTGNKYQLAN